MKKGAKINEEWEIFLHSWFEARNAHPTEQYGALKSLLQYADDVQELCDNKGECFSFWCSEILIGQNWKKQREAELAALEANINERIKEFNDKKEQEKSIAEFSATMTDEVVIDAIRQHEGILQKDFYKLYDHPQAKIVLKEKLYFMEKEGKIERIKSGNSYILKIVGE